MERWGLLFWGDLNDFKNVVLQNLTPNLIRILYSDFSSSNKHGGTMEKSSTFKKVYNGIFYSVILILLGIVVYGFAEELGINIFVFVFFFVLPFPLNYYLAVTRKKNVFLMLVLTLALSWLVTLVLAIQPVQTGKS